MVKLALAAVVSIGVVAGVGAQIPQSGSVRGAGATGSDLDAFMKQVLARRDDNWKKLQQYVLDERETINLRGPGKVQLWGERHDYTWYIRDGYFVRSPVRFNGVTIGEADRRKYENEYLERQKRRERRRAEREKAEKTENAGKAPDQDDAQAKVPDTSPAA